MKASGDLVIGLSGDRKSEFTAETRSRGEDQEPTTEARRHGERSRDREIACTRIGGAANSFHDLKIGHTVYTCHPERVGANATASRRTPTKTGPKYVVSGSSYEAADLTAEKRRRGEDQEPTTEARRHGKGSEDPVVKIMQTIKATLREIFDESAYDRFLLRTHDSRSVASYRAFMRERGSAMATKPKCC